MSYKKIDDKLEETIEQAPIVYSYSFEELEQEVVNCQDRLNGAELALEKAQERLAEAKKLGLTKEVEEVK